MVVPSKPLQVDKEIIPEHMMMMMMMTPEPRLLFSAVGHNSPTATGNQAAQRVTLESRERPPAAKFSESVHAATRGFDMRYKINCPRVVRATSLTSL